MPPGSPAAAASVWLPDSGAGEEVSAHAPGGAAGARIRTDGGEALDPRVGRGARWSVPTDRAPAPEAAAGCAVLAGHGGGDQPCGDRLPGAGGKGQEYPPPLAASGTGRKRQSGSRSLSGFLCSCFCWPGECCPLWGGCWANGSAPAGSSGVSGSRPAGQAGAPAGACIQRCCCAAAAWLLPSGCSSPSTPSGRRFCTTAR